MKCGSESVILRAESPAASHSCAESHRQQSKLEVTPEESVIIEAIAPLTGMGGGLALFLFGVPTEAGAMKKIWKVN